MPTITDEEMRAMLTKVKTYSLMILRGGPKLKEPDVQRIIWEHGRRNFELRAQGKLAIVCPIRDESDVCGIGIFNADVEETQQIMDGDPAVRAGIFVYDVHRCSSFPGDTLP
jgi:hypothetical protein